MVIRIRKMMNIVVMVIIKVCMILKNFFIRNCVLICNEYFKIYVDLVLGIEDYLIK